MQRVLVKRLSNFDAQLDLPSYQSELAAGADVRLSLAAENSLAEVTIAPGERVALPTGLAFEIPPGFELQVRPRSGLSLKTGLMVLNSPGTIDADYRGELKILMLNASSVPVLLKHGDRVAQLVLAPVSRANFEMVTELAESVRGLQGFGSTGLN